MVCGLWSSHGAALPEDWQAYRSAQERARDVEQADPRAAIDAWYAIFKERPKLDAWVGVLACSELVRLHYERVKDAKTALELCDWALKQYAGSPALARTAADKASVLLREGRPGEAEAAVAAHWDLVTRSYYAYSDAAVRQRFLALERQGKTAEAEELLAGALKEIPQLLDEAQQNPKGWIYNRLVHSLVGRQRADEALSWAKARFVTCRYDPAAMERSGRALVRARGPRDYRTTGLRDHGPGPFRNPLSEIRNPVLDQKSVAEILTRVQGGAQPTHDRISLHLLVGNVREAFLEARRLLVDNPDQPAGTLELCRVLKALELSPARANALVAYLREGTGADPLPEALRPLGITPEAFPAAVRAGQRTALANTPLVPGDALAEKLGQGAPLPETVAAAGLPAALPLPVPTDPAALLTAVAAPVEGSGSRVQGSGLPPLPLPVPGKVEVALPAWAAPPATAPVKAGPVAVAGVEGVGPAPVPAAPVPVVAGIEGIRPATRAVATPTPATPAPAVPSGRPETPAAAPTNAATPGIAMPTPVREDLAAITMALTRLQAGEITPEAAWEEGKLTADDIIRALEALPIWGHDAYANALTGLLVAHCPERVADTEALPAKLRVCLARHWSMAGDPRCVRIYEGLLRTPHSDAYVELAAAGLVEYHRAAGRIVQAAQVCLEAEGLSRNPAVRANLMADAARLFAAAGDEKRAVEMAERVRRYGYGWASGVALYDQAKRLLRRGEHEEARTLLVHEVTGRYADQVRPALLSLLGASYYMSGDLDRAEQYCHRAIKAYAAIAEPLKGEGLEAMVGDARRRLDYIDAWRRCPLSFSPQTLTVRARRDESGVERLVRIRALRPVPLTIRVSDVRLKAALVGRWETSDQQWECSILLQITVPPESLTDSFEAEVTVSGPAVRTGIMVPVKVHVLPPVTVSPSVILLGNIEPNKACTRYVRATGAVPFRVVAVRVDRPGVTAVLPGGSSSAEHDVEISFSPEADVPGGVYRGTIRIVTDMPGGHSAAVPYVGVLR